MCSEEDASLEFQWNNTSKKAWSKEKAKTVEVYNPLTSPIEPTGLA